MNPPNRYVPPEAPLEIDGGARPETSRKGFPWLFVLRYVVGVLVLVSGLPGIYLLSQSWARLAERAIILPDSSPILYLPMVLLHPATGVAILAKTRISLVLTLLWTASFLYLFWRLHLLNNPGSLFYLGLAMFIGLIAFQARLLARGLLK